jgi:hypothetical protein
LQAESDDLEVIGLAGPDVQIDRLGTVIDAIRRMVQAIEADPVGHDVNDEPESSVVYFSRDEETGIVHHELLFVGPATFETAVAQAKEKAPERGVERIHVKHARQANKPDTKTKPASKAKRKPIAKISVAKSKKLTPVKKTIAATTARRKQIA